MNPEKIEALDELIQLITSVMEDFTWYFIKIYLFRRMQLLTELTGNSDQIVRQRFEENRMDLFLDNINQLVQNKNAIYPTANLSIQAVFLFLEARIAAIATVAIVLSKDKQFLDPLKIVQIASRAQILKAKLSKLKSVLHDEAVILKKRKVGYAFAVHLQYLKGLFNVGNLILQAGSEQQILDGIQFNHNVMIESSGSTGGEVYLKQCSGFLILRGLENLRLIQIEDSPKLHLILVKSRFNSVTLTGELDSLQIQSCQIKKLNVSATIDTLTIEDNSSVSKATIKKSIIRRLSINQSHTAIEIDQSPLIHLISLTNKSLATISSDRSHIRDLFSDCFLYAIFTHSLLDNIHIQEAEFAYFYFDALSRLVKEDFLTPPHAYQKIKQHGKLLAFYSTKDIKTESPLVLDLTGNEEQTPTIESMSQSLAGDEIIHDWEIKPCLKYSSSHYVRDKKRFISQRIIQLGIVLLSHQIDPVLTIWRELCWHYSSIHQIKEKKNELTQSLLGLAYLKKIKHRLEVNYSSHAKILVTLPVRIQLFSLLSVDQIIRQTAYPDEIKSHYREDKVIIYSILQAIEYLSLYKSIGYFYSRKKERLKLILLNMIKSIVLNDKISIEEKRLLIIHRINDALMLNQQLLSRGTMMSLLVQTSLSILKNPKKITEKMVLSQCKSFCNQYRPVFSWFGIGKKKLACFRYLSLFITDRGLSLTHRLESMHQKINYLMQQVEETSAETRQETIMQSMPLWTKKSRKGRGYQFTLDCLNKCIQTYLSNGSDEIDSLLQAEIARPLIQQSQASFFKIHQLIGQKHDSMQRTTTR